MRLRKLELHGFKSFAKKTNLSFDTPITAIVGPNGSGKSNVVEAIRFVLGEQSMKSLRGGSTTDLIFRGSGQARDLNRASVAITFDNRDRVFKLTGTDNQQLSLDFDEIILSREIVRDGATTYAVNGTTVRLKDILEIIASVHIGSSGHHIISQGEADRLLNASPRERKSMLEDALGLKAYQYKIDEANRKLDKTSENLREAYALRRELQPQLKFLERQVKKIEQAKELQSELQVTYRQYLARQQALIKAQRTHWYEEKTRITTEQQQVAEKMEAYRADLAQVAEAKEEGVIAAKEQSRQQIARELQDLERKLGKVEAMIELAEASMAEANKPAKQDVSDQIIRIRETEVRSLVQNIDTQLQEILAETIEVARNRSGEVSTVVEQFFHERKHKQPEQPASTAMPSADRIEELRDDHARLVGQIQGLKEQESEIAEDVAEIRKQAEATRASLRDQEHAFFELSQQSQSLQTLVSRVDMHLEQLEGARERLQEEMNEAEVLVGQSVVANLESESIDREYQLYDEATTNRLVKEQEQTRREIERKKIKLEELGATADRDVITEYETTKERDEFFGREIADLETSMVQIGEVMANLTDELEREFREGLRLVNDQFDEFFNVLFGGGSASLQVVDIEKRRRSSDDESASEEDPEIEQGIEITVKLPRKKVQTLTMLSGGERSLTSIALLFALSQVKPPPFLVLDETDAALDEANSQRYGDMIERLAQKTQLITVTHNRETMSRAQVLYGVTLDQGGGSQVLSVKFDEAAEEYAK